MLRMLHQPNGPEHTFDFTTSSALGFSDFSNEWGLADAFPLVEAALVHAGILPLLDACENQQMSQESSGICLQMRTKAAVKSGDLQLSSQPACWPAYVSTGTCVCQIMAT